jgi:DNA uptake protein ComE-like DNA-binding protein
MHRTAAALVLATLLAACGNDAPEQDAATATPEATPSAAAPAPAAPVADTTVAPAAADGAMVDPNTATREQLTAAGLDAAAADALIQGRPYADMLAVDRVLAPLMGEPQRKAVYAKVWKPIALNSASEEEILLIPGVGPRMQHEFEEYRPYRNIEQFRREIGKYVDKEQVARFEKYVEIR